jgi:hypothetical protein
VCHCTHCQKTSGSAFSVNVFVPAEGLSFVGDPARYRDTSEGGRAVERLFCANCGSSIASVAEAFPGLVILKAGSLDDRSWLEPSAHVWTRSRQPWVSVPDGVTVFDKGRT